jgi:hypothetical protein
MKMISETMTGVGCSSLKIPLPDAFSAREERTKKLSLARTKEASVKNRSKQLNGGMKMEQLYVS